MDTEIVHSDVFERFEKFKVDDVMKLLPYDKRGRFIKDKLSTKKYGKYIISLKSLRYRTFKVKGTTCCACGLKASYFILEKHRHQRALKTHFNLYGVNNEGVEVMFTKDHIIPLSKGGKTNLKNMQTMCSICNGRKGNTIERISK